MNTIPNISPQAAEQRAAGVAQDLLDELLQADSQAKAVEVIAHHLTIAFAEARGPVWATAAGLASVLVPVLKAGVSALPKGGE
ncbi:hypothetical protein [Zoogloea sp.]|uniref:hypothetical protein n=1 Tax=Zoogloea sp. TaxID=49181 RepID=UPI0011DA69AC|nr:MAG: hypothetical protein E6Q92_13425 [Burkholderiaceae bacterium]